MKAKVSVIVPIYDVEPYIIRALDSLTCQTLEDIEIILVDDGSPDNCGKIADQYAEKYPNITAIHKENGGLSDARNTGLQKATGEYIGFVDPDDYAEPDMFEKLYNSAKENNSDIVLCGYKEVFSSSYAIERNMTVEKRTNSIFDLAYTNVCGNLGSYAWNKLYKTSLIKEHALSFPTGISVVEDIVFFFEFLKHAETYSVVNDRLYNYIRQPKSICALYQPERFEYYQIAADTIEAAVKVFDNEYIPKVLKQNRINELLNLLDTIDVQSGLKNSISVKKRYKELCNLISDGHFLQLIDRYEKDVSDKHYHHQMKLIKQNRKKTLFISEFFKMRIIARVKYYLSIGG